MILGAQKVGIVACSGEEFTTGTVTRVAARLVVEKLRPGETTVTCLPLLISGGEEEKSFVRNFPMITIDGCAIECSAKAVEKCGGKPRFNVSVEEIAKKNPELNLDDSTVEELGPNGLKLASIVAEEVAKKVDEIINEEMNRKQNGTK